MHYIQANRLSSEYINSLPIVRFQGKVVVVENKQIAETILDELRNERRVGFDTESKPAFKKGVSHPISLIQLSTCDTAFLFQLKKTGFPQLMTEFLADKKIKKIGVGLKNDIEKLQELVVFNPGGFLDLSDLAAEKGIIQVGARSLTARYMEKRLVKSSQKTNWAQYDLTRKQQIYAASDAWVCLVLYPHLLADHTDYSVFIEDEERERENNRTEKVELNASQAGR